MEPNWPEQTLEHSRAQSSAEIPAATDERFDFRTDFRSLNPFSLHLEPTKATSWQITWKTWPCISMGLRCSWICFHHPSATLFTSIVCGPLGSPRCNMFPFVVITGFGRLDWNPTAHFLGLAPILAVIKKQKKTKQEPRKKPLCFWCGSRQTCAHRNFNLWGLLGLDFASSFSRSCCWCFLELLSPGDRVAFVNLWSVSFRWKGEKRDLFLKFRLKVCLLFLVPSPRWLTFVLSDPGSGVRGQMLAGWNDSLFLVQTTLLFKAT